MDAARLREKLEANVRSWTKAEKLALLEALEEARVVIGGAEKDITRLTEERDWRYGQLVDTTRQRDAAQQDAKDARALAYEECARLIEDHHIAYSSHGPNYLAPRRDGDREGLAYAAAIRARIEAILEKNI